MTDGELLEQIEDALDWEPSIDVSDVDVTVDGGVVTLRGDVGSYAEKQAAERVVLSVYGVGGVANDLKVRLGREFERSDTDVAQAAVHAMKWNTQVPSDPHSAAEREEARRAAWAAPGVTVVEDHMAVVP
ncbi:MAG TPA: BON domain-containing protein [Vicinamibacterales bacterium]|nr:BON domain-containing protein [Vicinamibacterales bacterium]